MMVCGLMCVEVVCRGDMYRRWCVEEVCGDDVCVMVCRGDV